MAKKNIYQRKIWHAICITKKFSNFDLAMLVDADICVIRNYTNYLCRSRVLQKITRSKPFIYRLISPLGCLPPQILTKQRGLFDPNSGDFLPWK